MEYIVYHGTATEFNRFSLKTSAQGILWFSDDKDWIKRGESGAAGRSIILKCKIKIDNPAGWAEYENYGLGQLRDLKYDGIILPDGDNTTYVVFHPKQVKILDRERPLSETVNRMKSLIKH